jgi:hypothetical protein
LMWTGIAVAAVVTVTLTFVLPRLRRPGTGAHAST